MYKLILNLFNKLIDLFILIFILIFLFVGFSGLIDSKEIYSEASFEKYEKYIPKEKENSPSFEELKKLNSEVIGWLTIYGTNINYPILQGSDNIKYVNTSPLGEYSVTGSIFLDCDNNPDFSDFNSIIFGHHMDKNAMFGEIASFKNKDFFNNHEYGDIYINSKHYGLNFFSFLEVSAYDSYLYTPKIEDKETYLKYILDNSINTIPINNPSNIVLLSTCTNDLTNGRHILVGNITDKTYQNTFVNEVNSPTKITIHNINKHINNIFEKHLLTALTILLLILILILFLINLIEKKRNKDINIFQK